MNKAKVNELIPEAYMVLQNVKIANADKINKTYQRLLTSFGAAVYGGSLLAAIAFFSEEGTDKEEKKDREEKGDKDDNGKKKASDSVSRPKLMMAIYCLLTGKTENINHKSLFRYVKDELKAGNDEFELRDKILDAAVALKLAMNLYTLEKQNNSKSARATKEEPVKAENLAQGE